MDQMSFAGPGEQRTALSGPPNPHRTPLEPKPNATLYLQVNAEQKPDRPAGSPRRVIPLTGRRGSHKIYNDLQPSAAQMPPRAGTFYRPKARKFHMLCHFTTTAAHNTDFLRPANSPEQGR